MHLHEYKYTQEIGKHIMCDITFYSSSHCPLENEEMGGCFSSNIAESYRCNASESEIQIPKTLINDIGLC